MKKTAFILVLVSSAAWAQSGPMGVSPSSTLSAATTAAKNGPSIGSPLPLPVDGFRTIYGPTPIPIGALPESRVPMATTGQGSWAQTEPMPPLSLPGTNTPLPGGLKFPSLPSSGQGQQVEVYVPRVQAIFSGREPKVLVAGKRIGVGVKLPDSIYKVKSIQTESITLSNGKTLEIGDEIPANPAPKKKTEGESK